MKRTLLIEMINELPDDDIEPAFRLIESLVNHINTARAILACSPTTNLTGKRT